jgi:hypothetical protein
MRWPETLIRNWADRFAQKRASASHQAPTFRPRAGCSKHRQSGFVHLSMLLARWGKRPLSVQQLFASSASAPGVHFETYDPNTILRRRNLATNTGFSLGTTGAVPTDYIERGLVTGRKTVDATTATGFCMRVTSGGGTIASTDDVRLTTVNNLTVGSSYTVRVKMKRAPGFTDSTGRIAFGAAGANTFTLTDAYQSFSFSATATGTSHSLFFGGLAGALYDVSEVEVVKAADASQPYQAVTDWNTEFLAAGGDRVTMFTDAACTTPVVKVEDSIGGFISSERGTARGPEEITNGGFDSASNWTLDPSASISGGKLVIGSGGALPFASQNVASVSAGKAYEVRITIDAISPVTGGSGLSLRIGGTLGNVLSAPGTYREVIVAGATGVVIVNGRGSGVNSATVDNISVRALPGNVATQTTAGFKPKLDARVNLVTKTQDTNDAAWSKTATTVDSTKYTAPDGTQTAEKLTAAAGDLISQVATMPAAGATAKFTWRIKRDTHDWVRLTILNGANEVQGWFNLATGVKGSVSIAGTGQPVANRMESLGSGWYLCTLEGSIPSATAYTCVSSTAAADLSFTRVAGSRFVWGADVRTAADAALDIPAYQRVNTSTDYDWDGFPMRVRGDGSDDYLSVPLNMSTTDKVTAWVSGELKKSDAVVQALAELTSNSGTTAGGFGLFGPGGVATPTYSVRSSGNPASTSVAITPSNYAAPRNDVLMLEGGIANDVMNLYLNGTLLHSQPADQGTGNYANDTLYILARAGASLRSSAGWTALTIFGGTCTAGQRAAITRRHARLAKVRI